MWSCDYYIMSKRGRSNRLTGHDKVRGKQRGIFGTERKRGLPRDIHSINVEKKTERNNRNIYRLRRVNRYSLHSGIVSMREGNTFLRLDGFFSFFSRPPFFRPGPPASFFPLILFLKFPNKISTKFKSSEFTEKRTQKLAFGFLLLYKLGQLGVLDTHAREGGSDSTRTNRHH